MTARPVLKFKTSNLTRRHVTSHTVLSIDMLFLIFLQECKPKFRIIVTVSMPCTHGPRERHRLYAYGGLANITVTL